MPYTLCRLNFSHFSIHHSHNTGYKYLIPECDLRYDFQYKNIIIEIILTFNINESYKIFRESHVDLTQNPPKSKWRMWKNVWMDYFCFFMQVLLKPKVLRANRILTGVIPLLTCTNLLGEVIQWSCHTILSYWHIMTLA